MKPMDKIKVENKINILTLRNRDGILSDIRLLNEKGVKKAITNMDKLMEKLLAFNSLSKLLEL